MFFSSAFKIASFQDKPPSPDPPQSPCKPQLNLSITDTSPSPKDLCSSLGITNPASSQPGKNSSYSSGIKYTSLSYSSTSYSTSKSFTNYSRYKYFSTATRSLSEDNCKSKSNTTETFSSLPPHSNLSCKQSSSSDTASSFTYPTCSSYPAVSTNPDQTDDYVQFYPSRHTQKEPAKTAKPSTNSTPNFSQDSCNLDKPSASPPDFRLQSFPLTEEYPLTSWSPSEGASLLQSVEFSTSSDSTESDCLSQSVESDSLSQSDELPKSTDTIVPKYKSSCIKDPSRIKFKSPTEPRTHTSVKTVSAAEIASTSHNHRGHSMTGTKLHKKTSALFGYKYYSSKSSKSQSTSVPHTTQSKKLKHKKNMFNRLKSYEGPSSYLTSSKKEDYSKKGTSSATSSANSSAASPVIMPSPKATTTSSSSPSPSSSSASSPSLKRQTGLTGLLTCPVCLEDYQAEGPAGREPLFLSCHHSLCRACLPKLTRSSAGKYNSYSKEGNELSCPECRMVTQIPATGLTQNFYLVSLIETRELKPKDPSSRLRMWCNECHGIALETCIAHQVTHLSPVLVNYSTTYSRSRRQLVKYLTKRARHKGEEARDIKEAIEQLDLATTSLKRRLVAQLDYATLAQATASSLLQEIEQICRRVGLDDKLEIPCVGTPDSGVQSKTSGGLGADVMSSLLKDNFFQETRSKHFADSAMKDVDLLMFGNSSNDSSKSAPPPIRSHSADSSSSSNSPTLDRQVTFDHLSSQEQESKIMVLKESIASLEGMQDTLKQEERTNKEKLARIRSHGDNMPKETLSEMFNRALKSLS